MKLVIRSQLETPAMDVKCHEPGNYLTQDYHSKYPVGGAGVGVLDCP